MALPGAVLPFALALPKQSSVNRNRVLSKVFQVRGVARLEGDRLTLEWSGSVEITEVNEGGVRQLRESVPAQRLLLPAARIASIEARGRWWRPHIELRTTGIGPLELVPTASAGRLLLWIARRDWRVATDLVSRVQLEMAEAALREADQPARLPRESHTDR
jgi:hypothetical protein